VANKRMAVNSVVKSQNYKILIEWEKQKSTHLEYIN